MDFLGMRLNCDGITINPSKIKGLTDWPRELKNPKEVWKVLRVLGYQRLFILNFAGFAWPLTSLLKKDATFKWTPECRASLEMLIDIVTSSPILQCKADFSDLSATWIYSGYSSLKTHPFSMKQGAF